MASETLCSSDVDDDTSPWGVQLCITGFGKFAGVPTNPTSNLMASLPAALKTRPLPAFATVLCMSVLTVAAKAAPAEVAALAEQAGPIPPRTSRVWLHFGVAGGRTALCLEHNAVNEATFLCPDEGGEQPQGQCVVEGEALGTTRAPALPVPDLVQALCSRGHTAAASADAGRFLCNYIFYHSLARCSAEETAMFVHVPAAAQLPLPGLVEAAMDLLHCTAQAVSQGGGVAAAQCGPTVPPPPPPNPLVGDLVSMGFAPSAAATALAAVGGRSVDEALDWLMAQPEGWEAVPAQPSQSPPPDVASALAAGASSVAATATAASAHLQSAAVGGEGSLAPQLAAMLSQWSFDLKLVLLVDASHGMSPGKIAAQCSHAALAAARTADAVTVAQWGGAGEKIVVLSVPSGGALDALAAKASAAGLPVAAVRDAGRTEVAAGTRTVVAIGPAFASALDPVTGHLRTL